MGMIGALKGLIRKLIYKENATGADLVNYLRAHGAQIGEHVTIYAPNKTLIDKTAPWLLQIGDRVRITEGVKILTHDYSWSVLKCCESEQICPGSVLGAQSAVKIGSNVFVGMNAIITRGVTVGDNVVIGAGSVVTKDCEADSVYAGNPAQRLMSVEEFYEKRAQWQFAEAKALAVRYKERFGTEPPQDVFGEYFMLFSTADTAPEVPRFRYQMETSGNYAQCLQYMRSHEPMFADYAAFLQACYQDAER